MARNMESSNGDILEQWFSSIIKDIDEILRAENEDRSRERWIKIAFLIRDLSVNYAKRVDHLHSECLSQAHRLGNSKKSTPLQQKRIEKKQVANVAKGKKTNRAIHTNKTECSRIPLQICRKGIDITKDKLLKMGCPPRGIFLKIAPQEKMMMDVFLIENEMDGNGQIFGKKSGFLLNQMYVNNVPDVNEDNHEILEQQEENQMYGHLTVDKDFSIDVTDEQLANEEENRDSQESGAGMASQSFINVEDSQDNDFEHWSLLLQTGSDWSRLVNTGPDWSRLFQTGPDWSSQEETTLDNVHFRYIGPANVENCDENSNTSLIDNKYQHDNFRNTQDSGIEMSSQSFINDEDNQDHDFGLGIVSQEETVLDNVNFRYIGPSNENSNTSLMGNEDQHENLENTQDSEVGTASQRFINDEDNQDHDLRYIARGYRYIGPANVENHDENSNASLMGNKNHHEYLGNTQDSGVGMDSQSFINDEVELTMVNQEETVLDNIHFRYIGPANVENNDENSNTSLTGNEESAGMVRDRAPEHPRTRAALAQYIAKKDQHENVGKSQDSGASQDEIGIDQADFLNQLGLNKLTTNNNQMYVNEDNHEILEQKEENLTVDKDFSIDVTDEQFANEEENRDSQESGAGMASQNDFVSLVENGTNVPNINIELNTTTLLKTPKKRKRRESGKHLV